MRIPTVACMGVLGTTHVPHSRGPYKPVGYFPPAVTVLDVQHESVGLHMSDSISMHKR